MNATGSRKPHVIARASAGLSLALLIVSIPGLLRRHAQSQLPPVATVVVSALGV